VIQEAAGHFQRLVAKQDSLARLKNEVVSSKIITKLHNPKQRRFAPGFVHVQRRSIGFNPLTNEIPVSPVKAVLVTKGCFQPFGLDALRSEQFRWSLWRKLCNWHRPQFRSALTAMRGRVL